MFGLPWGLWLQIRSVGEVLWVYNEEHVDELAKYVSAPLPGVADQVDVLPDPSLDETLA